MNLIKLDDLQLHHGEQVIFDHLQIALKKGDRLCLVGRNGVGKSTLLKTLQGTVEPDSGHVWRDPSIKIAGLMQDLPEAHDQTVFEFVAEGLAELGRDLARYSTLAHNSDPRSLQELGDIQQRIEAADGWTAHNQIEQVLTRLELDGSTKLSDLSGGWRRRVALAQALACRPDVLLLDEPTNHLDVVAIEWLERQLVDFNGAVVFVTHDRAFLRKVANRIGELDRGNISLWEGDYAGFLAFRERQWAEEQKHNALFDKRLAQEEVWIRQGIKARRTRNEGRVRALEKMRRERAQRREKQQNVKMAVGTDGISGKLVAQFRDVHFAWEDKTIARGFTGTVVRGDKIGLIGPNGVGKSTFLKLLLGDLQPDAGEVRLGTNLSVAYFDQLRDQLELNKSAADNVSEGRDFIEINGQSKHIIAYLGDFLFTGERARTPIRALSGGERNRVLLAKLFSKPANCLVMDEPTNDLDAETLELLEDLLTAFTGTLFLVSHDREFLDNVVSSTISFEGNGVIKEYVGGYQDWLRQGGVWAQANQVNQDDTPSSGGQPQEVAQPAAQSEPVSGASSATSAQKAAKKLSYKLQLELDELPGEIERLEAELEALQAEVSQPEFYQRSQDDIAAKTEHLAKRTDVLKRCYARWEALEEMREGA